MCGALVACDLVVAWFFGCVSCLVGCVVFWFTVCFVVCWLVFSFLYCLLVVLLLCDLRGLCWCFVFVKCCSFLLFACDCCSWFGMFADLTVFYLFSLLVF